jgi:pyridoxal phosphate enzyme (YggS family)
LSPSALADRLARVRELAAAAARRAGRDPAAVTLVAISKKMPSEAIREALEAGQLDFGENYAQELRDKMAALEGTRARWHFVGSLQRNKVKYVAGRVHLIHGVDDPALLPEIDRRAQGVPQDVLVEVSLAGEAQKGGVTPDALPTLLDAFAGLARVRCVGLMCMPPPADDAEASRPYFRQLRELLQREATHARANVALTELSMGMSGDYQVAVEEGATLIRVGTAIFGPRPALSTAGLS